MKLITSQNRSGKAAKPISPVDPAPSIPKGSMIAFDPAAPTIGTDVVILLRMSNDGMSVLAPETYSEVGNDYSSFALVCYSDLVASEGCYAVHTLARVVGLSAPGRVGDETYYTLLLETLNRPGQAPMYSFAYGAYACNVKMLDIDMASNPVVIRPSYERCRMELPLQESINILWANLEGHGFGCQVLDEKGQPAIIFPVKLRPSIGTSCSLSFSIPLVVSGGVPIAGIMDLEAPKGDGKAQTSDVVNLFAPVIMEPKDASDWNLYWSCISIDPSTKAISNQLFVQGNVATRYSELVNRQELFQFDVSFTGEELQSTP